MHNFRTWADNTGQDIEARSQWRVEQMRIQLDRLHLGVPQQLTDHLERSAAAPEARQSCGAGHGSVYPQSRLPAHLMDALHGSTVAADAVAQNLRKSLG